MASRNTSRALLLIILVLLISNLVIIYLFVLSPGLERNKRMNRGKEEGLATILKDSIGFNAQQVARYLDLRNSERPGLRELFSEMRATKRNFYQLTTPPAPDSVVTGLADSIGQVQRKIDLQMRNYFLKIRGICEASQVQAFDSIMSRVIIDKMIGRQNSRNRGNNPKNQR